MTDLLRPTELHVAGAITPEGAVSPARIRIRDGRIAGVDEYAGPTAPLWAVPGFIDTHTHGALGTDFNSADADGVRRILQWQRSHGTTTVLASLLTAPIPQLVRQLELLTGFAEAGEIAGIHLEGPFLSAAKCGAHPAEHLRTPDAATMATLLEAGHGHIAMVTLAPELPGAWALIDQLLEAGVQVAFGHSAADAATTARAIAAGVSIATHLFNAMEPIHHRVPGPIPQLLGDPRVAVELICDGIHVAQEVIQLTIDAAGVDRVMLVSDTMAAAGCGDGEYALGDRPVVVREGRATDPAGRLAGSTSAADAAFAELVREGCTLAEAAAMASTTPARVHGFTDIGELRRGTWADLVLVDGVGAAARVMRRGTWLEPGTVDDPIAPMA
ncbi:N-acetylglucosamine-6-phosphate deacetylase [Granulicoccus phenolivorans]|uniref:N-acetylglucosamine-6-phosphate deacetylase n=1 Tax=Granulicoccus phenolivorans TaxID=266854 RepID=UPI00040474DD|nr:amidohydrolase family protein [Granulicoccus phenolivorans]